MGEKTMNKIFETTGQNEKQLTLYIYYVNLRKK